MYRQSNEANAKVDAFLDQMMADRQATDWVMTTMLETLGRVTQGEEYQHPGTHKHPTHVGQSIRMPYPPHAMPTG